METTIAKVLQEQLDQYEGLPGIGAQVRNALGVSPDTDIPDIVLAWRFAITETVGVIWLVTEGGFVFLSVAADGTVYVSAIPSWRIRQVIERVENGEITVAIEVEADTGAIEGHLNSDTGAITLRPVPFQFRASEMIPAEGEAPLQLVARALRGLCVNV